MNIQLKPGERTAYNFKKPDATRSVEASDPAFHALVSTRAFRRLKEIRFLGGIDYLKVPSPNGKRGNVRYTRYQHSLGVAGLANSYCMAQGLVASDRRLVVAAALLHDIGHAPLSHSLEPVFKDVFGIDHHEATIATIRGNLGDREIEGALREHRVDIDAVVALIAGRNHRYDGLFSGPINFDTIEGVLRTKEYYVKSQATGLNPETVMLAAIGRLGEADRGTVDEFWRAKDLVYRHIIGSDDGVLADEACRTFMRNNIGRFSAADYFSTENKVFAKLPGLKKLLTSADFRTAVWSHVTPRITFRSRQFYIETTATGGHARYKQRRIDKVLSMKRSSHHSAPMQDQEFLI